MLAVSAAAAVSSARASVTTVIGGDAGEGITLVPAAIVDSSSAVDTSVQGVSTVLNKFTHTFSNGLVGYTAVYAGETATTNDVNMAAILNAAAVTGGGETITFTSGTNPVVAGNFYKIEVLIADNAAGPRTQTYAFNGVPAPLDTVTTVPGLGHNISETVLALPTGVGTEGTFSFSYDVPTGNGAGFPILSAFFVSNAVPEPSVIGLLGVAGAGLLARRRRI